MRLLGLLFTLLATPLFAQCNDITFDHTSFTLCTVDPATQTLRLFHSGADDTVLGTFRRVADSLPDDETLVFAMNAGMYHPDRSPVGYYFEDDVAVKPLLKHASTGNFGMLPNGVFCIGDTSALVVETLRFVDQNPACRFATQSGPMLVIDGELHPRFLPDSSTSYIRNGVGVDDKGRAYFAISNAPVTFHKFGRLFRDHLNVQNALYFDGKVSRLFAPELGRWDAGFPMGPIVGLVAKR